MAQAEKNWTAVSQKLISTAASLEKLSLSCFYTSLSRKELALHNSEGGRKGQALVWSRGECSHAGRAPIHALV
jgi:hypothetical protein